MNRLSLPGSSSIAMLVVTLAGLVGACGTGQNSVRLQYRFAVGETHSMMTVTEQDISQTIMGQQQNTKMTERAGVTLTVLEVDDDGSAQLRVTYESIAVNSTGPMGSFEFDSRNPPDDVPPMLAPYAALAGATLTLRMSPNGIVSEVEGWDEIMDAMLSGMPEGPMREQLRGGMDQMLESISFKVTLLPIDPVSIGDSWTHSTSTAGMPMSLETTYTLSSRQDGVALIDVESVIGVEGATMEMGPMEMHVDLSGEQTGTMEVDEATGWTIRSRLEGEFSGFVTIEGMGMPGGGEIPMEIPMTVKSAVTVEPLAGG